MPETVSKDGTKLHLTRWEAEGTRRAALLIVHGYFEHGERYDETARSLTPHGIEVWALDLRGHGGSAGTRGHIRSVDEYLDDVDAGLAVMKDGPRFILAQSMGGLVALLWAARRASAGVRGVVVTNPYLERAMVVPQWKIGLARFMARVVPTFSLPSGLDSSLLSHDAAKNDAYKTDGRIFQHATAGWFIAVTRAQEEAARLETVPIPLLCVLGDGDRIARPQATLAFFERVQGPEKTLKVLPGQYHEVLNEPERSITCDAIATWILQRSG